MSYSISKWLDGYQAPANLMIDDLSDVYIKIYKTSYKNDWGYMCDKEGSSYHFLKKNLLNKFSNIKITFFVPYKRHNVVNSTIDNYKKYAIGERNEFSIFLKMLVEEGHEIAHHGSNHGEYIDESKIDTENNFMHEWELFDSVIEGVSVTTLGKDIFKKEVETEITGGKFCGYLMRENSLEIIDKSGLEYWCIDAKLDPDDSDIYLFGDNNVIAFPTNFNGNGFVRLKYKTGRLKRDVMKLFTRFMQPLYNVLQYKKLDKLYEKGSIISIQEHISPATSSGAIQASNIVSDMESLSKIFSYLSKKSIWYATCQEIARYIYVRMNCIISSSDDKINIIFNDYKKLGSNYLTIYTHKEDTLEDSDGNKFTSVSKDNKYFFTLRVDCGENNYYLLSK